VTADKAGKFQPRSAFAKCATLISALTERRYSKRMNRILVIRGGAIGDFILTLPTLKALREAYPHTHLEILGYKHIAVLAQNRFYAQAVRSIEYGALASFFAKNSELPPELANHFASFDLIVSYLYDPDGIFENNLRRCGVENLIQGPAKVDDREHAARQLARPLEELGLRASDFAPRIYHSTKSRKFAEDFLRGMPRPIFAMHPGSGSETKNWPIENWIEFGLGSGAFQSATGEYGRLGNSECFRERWRSFLIVSGEADENGCARLEREWKDRDVRFAKNLPLPHLAAVLENSIFVGHDTGISHLAAAAGAKCILLFGPTDPDIWAPMNENVEVIRAVSGKLSDIGIIEVEAALAAALSAARCVP
jgi:heptosyltransferase-3